MPVPAGGQVQLRTWCVGPLAPTQHARVHTLWSQYARTPHVHTSQHTAHGPLVGRTCSKVTVAAAVGANRLTGSLRAEVLFVGVEVFKRDQGEELERPGAAAGAVCCGATSSAALSITLRPAAAWPATMRKQAPGESRR